MVLMLSAVTGERVQRGRRLTETMCGTLLKLAGGVVSGLMAGSSRQ